MLIKENEFRQLVAVFLLAFLLIISLSSAFIGSGIGTTFNALEVSLIASLISFILLKKLKDSITLILWMLITTLLSHIVSIYLILPVGVSSDQRVFFIDIIKKYGNIYPLRMYDYEGIYYTHYPISWLTASLISMISGIDTGTSWLVTIVGAYICFIVFLILVSITFFKISASNATTLISLLLMVTIYLHRPFQDLIPSAFGVLSLALALYLFALHDKPSLILLVFSIPLFIAHALPAYVTIFLFALIAISTLVTRAPEKEAKRAIMFAVIVFTGTWIYQIGSQVLEMLVGEVPYRWNQILNAITSQLFEIPRTASIMEQNLHYIYPFDHFITPLAYVFPVILTAVSTIYFFYKFKHVRDRRVATLMLFSITSLSMFVIGGFFAWKGIENAIARYLYVYSSPISIFVNIALLNSIIRRNNSSFRKNALILFVLASIGIIISFESLYTPYASPLSIPDKYKFEKLYQNYYAPSMFNENLVHGVSKHILEALRKGEIHIYETSFTENNIKNYSKIVYSNGFIIANG